MAVRAAFTMALWLGAMLPVQTGFAAPNDGPLVAPPQTPACQACHGKDGISVSADIPNLAGQKKAYIVHQLMAFRTGTRKNELMSAIATQLSDAEIDMLATFWSRQPRAGMEGPPSVAALPSHLGLPADFPAGFALYQTESDPAAGNLTRRYVDNKALVALRKGASLPLGTLLVSATHELPLDTAGKPLVDREGRPVAGKAVSYAAMGTGEGWGSSIPAPLRNGDWNYALFGADRVRRDNVTQAACLACHKPAASDDYVFTMNQLKAFATQN